MQEFKLFGATVKHKPNTKVEMLQLNGFMYSKSEVLEALKARGYQIKIWKYQDDDQNAAECAVKNGEQPSEENMWHKVGKKVLEIRIKPKL